MTKLPDPGSVVKIGDGRGFVISHRVKIRPLPSSQIPGNKFRILPFREDRLVVTAAHCLPEWPPASAATLSEERTWKLLGTLDGHKKGILVECLFVNPIADIAVLGCPDSQMSGEFYDLYCELTEAVDPFRIGRACSGQGWVLSLDGKWIRTTLEIFGERHLWIDPTEGGMSGSPVLDEAGRAVAVVAIGAEKVSHDGTCTKERCGTQPILRNDLPGWLLRR
jgi:hypothetical protein